MELLTALLGWFSHRSQSFHPNHQVGPLFYHTSTVIDSVLTQCLIHSLTVKEVKGTEDFISVLCPKLSSMPCILSGALKPGITSSDQEFTSISCKPVILTAARTRWALVSEFLGVCKLSLQRGCGQCEISDAGYCGIVTGPFGQPAV